MDTIINKIYKSFREKNSKNFLFLIRGYGWSIIRALIIISISYVIFFPVLSKISTAFMSFSDVYDSSVIWIPKSPTFYNINFVYDVLDFPQTFINSLLLTTLLTLLQLMSCTMIGYGLARFKSRMNQPLFFLILFTLIVPPTLIMIPLYLNFRYFNIFITELNLINTSWPMILMSITGLGFRNGLFIYIMRQYFKGMPKNLEEAAYVDGAGPFQVFYKVMLPGALPPIIVVLLFAFVWQWSDQIYTGTFMGSMELLPNGLMTLRRDVSLLISERLGLPQNAVITHTPILPMMKNTATLMFMSPLIVLYVFMQRYFVESIERTGIVG